MGGQRTDGNSRGVVSVLSRLRQMDRRWLAVIEMLRLGSVVRSVVRSVGRSVGRTTRSEIFAKPQPAAAAAARLFLRTAPTRDYDGPTTNRFHRGDVGTTRRADKPSKTSASRGRSSLSSDRTRETSARATGERRPESSARVPGYWEKSTYQGKNHPGKKV